MTDSDPVAAEPGPAAAPAPAPEPWPLAELYPACFDWEHLRPQYPNHSVEQDRRAIKRIVRPMLGFKSFARARALIAGIETMHMIRKGRFDRPESQASSAANQFYSLAFRAAANSAASRCLSPLLRQNPQHRLGADA